MTSSCKTFLLLSHRPFQKYHNTLCCLSIVFNFSWDNNKSRENLKTMIMQNFGGKTKSVVVWRQSLSWPIKSQIKTNGWLLATISRPWHPLHLLVLDLIGFSSCALIGQSSYFYFFGQEVVCNLHCCPNWNICSSVEFAAIPVPFGYSRSSDLSPLKFPMSPCVLPIISSLALRLICKRPIPGVTSIEKPDGKETMMVLLLTELLSREIISRAGPSLKSSIVWFVQELSARRITVILRLPGNESSKRICAVSLVFVLSAKPEKTVALLSSPSGVRGRFVLPCKWSELSRARIKT